MAYLDQFRVLESRDLDDLREVIARLSQVKRLDLLEPGGEIAAIANFAPMSRISLAYAEYGDVRLSLEAEGGNNDNLTVILPLSGSGVARQPGWEHEFSSRRGFVRDMALPMFATQSDFTILALSVDRSTLRRHAEVMTGEEISPTELTIAPNFDLEDPQGNLFAQSLRFVAEQLDEGLGAAQNPALFDAFEDLLLTQLLLLPGGGLSDRLASAAGHTVLPRHAKRACEFIHADPGRSITAATLAEAAGCSYRTLQIAFGQAFGVSPMTYVKNLRLDGVRAALADSRNDEPISVLAARWGFSHMGHFARDFRERFGISPSEARRFDL